MDKVRVGVWLAYNTLHKEFFRPKFRIDQRLGTKDRIAIISVEITHRGSASLEQQHLPSVQILASTASAIRRRRRKRCLSPDQSRAGGKQQHPRMVQQRDDRRAEERYRHVGHRIGHNGAAANDDRPATWPIIVSCFRSSAVIVVLPVSARRSIIRAIVMTMVPTPACRRARPSFVSILAEW